MYSTVPVETLPVGGVNVAIAVVAASDVAPVNSRFGPHSGYPGTSDISDSMAGFKVLLTLPA